MKQLVHLSIAGVKSHESLRLRVPRLLALQGPNGCGKSAVLQAIRLAVLGYEPAIGKTLAATRQLVNHAVDAAEISLEFEDGFAINRKLGATTETSVMPLRTERTEKEMQARIDAELGTFVPSFDLAAFLELSAEKRREFLLRLLPRRDTTLDQDKWRVWLGWAAADEKIQTAIDWLWTEKVLTSPSLLDGLATALEATTEKFNAAEVERRDQEKIAARADADARGSVAFDWDRGRLGELQEELGPLQLRLAEIEAAAAGAERARTEARHREHQLKVVQMRVDDARKHLERLRAATTDDVPESAIATARAAADYATRKARSQQEAVRYAGERLAAVRTRLADVQLRLAALGDRDSCPTCGHAGDMAAVRTALRDIADTFGKQVADAEERLTAAEALQRELDAAAATALLEVRQLETAAERAAQAAQRVAEAEARLGEARDDLHRTQALPPIDVTEPDTAGVTEARARIGELQAAITAEAEKARQAGRADGDRIRADREANLLAEKRARAEALKRLKDAQQKLRAHVITELVQPVEYAANDLLQLIDPAKEFRFLFEREGRSDFDFGFVEDGVFRSYDAASTGEDGFLAVVLVAALISVVQPAWRVLMVDNVETIDDQRRRFLQLAIERVSERFDNVIIAGCCRFAAVEGWDIVEPRNTLAAVAA